VRPKKKPVCSYKEAGFSASSSWSILSAFSRVRESRAFSASCSRRSRMSRLLVRRLRRARVESAGAFGFGLGSALRASARAIAFCTAPLETLNRCARARCDSPARYAARTSASDTGRRRSVPIAEDRLLRGTLERAGGGAERV
jgi:hypothetical protein